MLSIDTIARVAVNTVCTGVTLQKVPDRAFGLTAAHAVCTLQDIVGLILVRNENQAWTMDART